MRKQLTGSEGQLWPKKGRKNFRALCAISLLLILVIFILVDYLVNSMKDYTDLNYIPTFGNFNP